MPYIQQTGVPASEPVTAAHFQEFESLPSGLLGQTSLVTAMLKAARVEGEKLCGRALARRAFLQSWDHFPARELWLYYPPLVSVSAVKYLDPQGVLQTLATDQYVVDAISQPGRVALAPGASWPATQCVPNAARVEFTAGYDPDPAVAAGIPENLRLGILNLASFWFKNRGAITDTAATGKGFDVPPYIAAIFTTERVADLPDCPQLRLY